MKCPKCGLDLEVGARFCGGCGTPMAAVAPGDILPAGMKTMVSGSGGPMNMPPVAKPAPPKAATPPGAAAPQGKGPVAPSPATTTPLRPLPMPAPAPARAPAPAPAPAPAKPPVIRAGGGPVGPAMPAAPADPFIGRTLNNRYVVENKLGEGGFGAVYRGKQLQIGREVALKLLHPEMARDPNLVARFRREGAVACSLRDAHTITTFDFDQTPEGVLYIAMELLKGKSLHDIFRDEAPIAWARVLKVLEQMCSSLAEAHQQGIVHRDLKPENIYLEPRPGDPEFVKVLDFGIAKIVSGEIGSQSPQLTATGQTLGTLEYMSPEQLMGKPLDGRSDIYAVGVVAYELMTGRLPFPDAQGPAALIAAQLKKTPVPPSAARPDAGIPPGVDALILKTLEKDKNKRFADVTELGAACRETIANGGRVSASAAASAPAMNTPAPQMNMPAPQVQRPMTPPPIAQAGGMMPPAPNPMGMPPPMSMSSMPQAPRPVGPATEQVISQATGSRLWLWLVIAVVVIGGGIGVYLALT